MLTPVEIFILSRLQEKKPFMGKGNASAGYKHSAILSALEALLEKGLIDGRMEAITEKGKQQLKNSQ